MTAEEEPTQESSLLECELPEVKVEGELPEVKVEGELPEIKVEISEKKNGAPPKPGGLWYGMNDNLPWHTALFLGLQHFLVMFMSQVAAATVVADVICMGDDVLSRGQLISTILLVAGIATLLQTFLGNRLPIIQGSSASFLPPIYALMSLPQWRCGATFMETADNITSGNLTAFNQSSVEVPVTWQMRMNEIQGALLGAAIFHILVGYTGLLGILLRFVGPLVVCVVITTLSIPLIHIGTMLSGFSWPFAIITFILAVVMGQYCSQLKFPIPFFSIKKRQCTFSWFPVFQTYPIILALLISWFLCYVLTTVGVLDGTDSWKVAVRTDTKAEALANSAWLRVPYPFQWGMPTFSATSTIGMITGVLASTLESIGDYYACARLAGAPRPPVSAVNRGIGTEGIGNVLCAMWGCGIGTTSYSDNIGIIAITKVGNRRVVQMAACWMILFGILSKLGALFAAVPIPIIGGITLFIVGFVVSAGLSELQFVNMKRSRNMFVLGASLTLGIGVPVWIDGHPGVINTGSMTGDQILLVLLKSNMLVGGLMALILDNTLPDPDRAISTEESLSEKDEDTGDIYDFPCGMQFLRKIRCFRWTPCCPTFKGYRVPGYKNCKTPAAS